MAYYRTIECTCGCAVNSNFGSYDNFTKVEKAQLLSCAICGSSDVKALMPTPNTRTSEQNERTDTLTFRGVPAELVGDRFYEAVDSMLAGRQPRRGVIGTPTAEQVADLEARGEKLTEIVPVVGTVRPRTYDA